MLANLSPNVGSAARHQNRVSGRQGQFLIPDLHAKLSFKRIQPFVLCRVEMPIGSSLSKVVMLHDEHSTCSLRG